MFFVPPSLSPFTTLNSVLFFFQIFSFLFYSKFSPSFSGNKHMLLPILYSIPSYPLDFKNNSFFFFFNFFLFSQMGSLKIWSLWYKSATNIKKFVFFSNGYSKNLFFMILECYKHQNDEELCKSLYFSLMGTLKVWSLWCKSARIIKMRGSYAKVCIFL